MASPHLQSTSKAGNKSKVKLATNLEHRTSFLDLPLELRLMVYEQLFGVNLIVTVSTRVRRRSYRDLRRISDRSKIQTKVTEAIQKRVGKGSRGGKVSKSFTKKYKEVTQTRSLLPTQGAAILAVNKQVYNEALPILFAKKTFEFELNANLVNFLSEVKRGVPYIERLAFHGLPRIAPTMRKAVRLQELVVGLTSRMVAGLNSKTGSDDYTWCYGNVLEATENFIRRLGKGGIRREKFGTIVFKKLTVDYATAPLESWANELKVSIEKDMVEKGFLA